VALEWSQILKAARERLGLSRAELALRASLSTETVRAYETGRRRATIQSLPLILDALKLERRERNQALVSAGFAPDGALLGPARAPGYNFTLEEAALEVEQYSWPSVVLNDVMEVVVANRVTQRLWGIDLDREFSDPLDRNLLSVASDPRFAPKVLNWDEAVAHAVSVLKGHHLGPETRPEGSSPYFATVMKRFMAGDPTYVRRFLKVWEDTPPRDPKIRWSYPIVWDEPDVGVLRFHVLVSSCNEPEGLAFNDWIPLDAETWRGLEKIRILR
jgi:transcriptional regulator with XRE-family HTH domain